WDTYTEMFANKPLQPTVFTEQKTLQNQLSFKVKKKVKQLLGRDGREKLSNDILYNQFHLTMLPTILRNFDKMAMQHSIEIRMPFMDWRLVTFVFSLPDESK